MRWLRSCVVVLVAVSVLSGVVAAAPGSVALAQTGGFADVGEGEYYTEPVAALAAAGVFDGTGCVAGFCPGEPIDRKTMAVWVVRVLDGADPPAVFESRFDDVDAGGFHARFVERMAELQVTLGCGDGGFCPHSDVTRAQMAVFLTRAFSLAAGPDPGFGDVAADAWYADGVAALAASGITVGCGDGRYCPGGSTTRAEMATFLHRALNADLARPTVRVPAGGGAVTVPRGASLVAEVGAVTVEAPAGTFTGDARVYVARTDVGAGRAAKGEKLAAAPVAMSVTGAEVVRPMTLRFEVDTSALTPTGVVPAWYSDELGAWVPLKARGVTIGDGEVTVTATLNDARTAASAGSAAMVHSGVGGSGASPALAVPVIVVALIVFVVVAGVVGVVALTSDTVHDALKKFFGIYADEPSCSGGLPSWVAGFSDADEALKGLRPRMHTCGETAGDDLRVKVANNRNYGVELTTPRNRHSVSMPGGENPTGLLDIAIKEAAEKDVGGTYLWPLSTSSFRLPVQSSDWRTELQTTGVTLAIDSVRIGLDLLKIVLPGVAAADDAGIVTCIIGLSDQVGRSSVDIDDTYDWMSVLGTVEGCFDPGLITGSSDREKALRKGMGEVKNALGWASTAASAAKWGLTAADAIKDARRPPATITVKTHTQSPQPAPDGTATDPADTEHTKFTTVSAGVRYTCGLLEDGTARCWGQNPGISPDDIRLKTISAGKSQAGHSCGLLTDGTARCWGNDYAGRATPPADTKFKTISAGRVHTCGVRTDGRARCWGDHEDRKADPPADITFKTISAGVNHTCGVLTDGRARCWGNNEHGQATPPADTNFKTISAGNGHTCGVLTDGRARCWGNNEYGEADPPTGARFKTISAGGAHTCGVLTDGRARCWGSDYVGYVDWGVATPPAGYRFTTVSAGASHSCGVLTDGRVRCWGHDHYGQADPPADATLTMISPGGRFSCAVLTDDRVRCWGDYLDRNHGAVDRMVPLAGTRLTAISVGSEHSCGLRDDGHVQCWGVGYAGHSYHDQVYYPPADAGFTTVSTGNLHTCALRTDGRVRCWGSNFAGQADPPIGVRFTTISAGGNNTCGLLDDGRARCWGANDDGQADVPAGARFTAISAGWGHTCGVLADGTARCWGGDYYGQVEDTPADARFTAISAGNARSCGLLDDGSVKCWGWSADDGQYDSPAGAKFTTVSTGGGYVCGLLDDGTARCWGGLLWWS